MCTRVRWFPFIGRIDGKVTLKEKGGPDQRLNERHLWRNVRTRYSAASTEERPALLVAAAVGGAFGPSISYYPRTNVPS